MKKKYRKESDAMGEIRLPADALWGAQTQRAVENFSVSPLNISPVMVKALGLIKKHAALTNHALGLLPEKEALAIAAAADKLIAGEVGEHFPIDVFQTGSGTSWNMNANEVIANLANLSLGGEVGGRSPVHPNDHVNKGQSSNDVIPAAINLANRLELKATLGEMKALAEGFARKADEFKDVIKLGRTHLQDAVPMTLGQEFSVFALQVEKCYSRLSSLAGELEGLPLGRNRRGDRPECPRRICPPDGGRHRRRNRISLLLPGE